MCGERYDDATQVERGYITSGALLPDQDVADGVVVFRLVEGAVTQINVTGTSQLNDDYLPSLGKIVQTTALKLSAHLGGRRNR